MVLQDHDEEALTHLRDLMRYGFDGPWEVEVAPGPLADTHIRVAHARGAERIVMGRHGRRGLYHVFHGSVAHRWSGWRRVPC